jgi:hypothetical protein
MTLGVFSPLGSIGWRGEGQIPRLRERERVAEGRVRVEREKLTDVGEVRHVQPFNCVYPLGVFIHTKAQP